MFHKHHATVVELSAETQRLLASLTSNLIARNYDMASLDLTALNANTDEIKRIAAAAAAGDGGTVAAAVAAQLESDQAQVAQVASDQAAAIAPLTAEFPATLTP